MEAETAELDWTFEMVEGRLVEAMRLWWRAPGGGRWPYASDAPWHLMRRVNQRGDAFEFYDPRGFDQKSSDVPLRPLPLAMAEIGRRDEASAWIERYVMEEDRRLVALALVVKASGRSVQWRRMLPKLGLTRGADRVRMRYSRAITRVVKGLVSDQISIVAARD